MIMSTAAIKNIEKQVFTPSQYHAAMSEIENYISRGFENLNKEEANHLDELSDKVHEYESRKYPMPMEGYMIANNLNRVKLGSVLKVSGSTISDILNGKKGISFPLAVRMHQILNIDAEELLNVKIVSSSPVRRVGFSQSQKTSAGQINLSYRKKSTTNKSAVKKAAKKK
jgi:antitoxin component HigA of HigAB toxin-antitoxin module